MRPLNRLFSQEPLRRKQILTRPRTFPLGSDPSSIVHSREARFKVPAASNCRRMREMEGQRKEKGRAARNSLIKITRPTDEAWAGGGNGMEGGLCKWTE